MASKSSNSFSKFISGKGFYVALAVCLVGAGSAAWVAADRTINSIENQPVPNPVEEIVEVPKDESGLALPEDITPEEPAATTKQEVKKPETSLELYSAEQTPSSWQEKSSEESKPTEQSEPSQQPEKSQTVSFELPVNGEILAEYSEGELVKNETLGDWRTHNGVDIKAEQGAEIMSSTDGKITSVKNDAMWGTVVEIDCGSGYMIIYRGLAEDKNLKAGDKVESGKKLGTVGEIACEASLDPHIHLEIKQNGKYINPLSVLKY